MFRTLFALVWISLSAITTRAADVPVLTHVPKGAGVVLVCEKPHAMAEALQTHSLWPGILALPQVNAVLEQPSVIRAQRVLAHVERELNAKWPEIVKGVAGNGIAISFNFGDNPPVLITLNGTDKALSAKALKLFLTFATGDGNTKLTTGQVKDTTTYSLGKDLHYAQVGTVTYISTKLDVLKRILTTQPTVENNIGKTASVQAARNLIAGETAMVWGWLDFDQVKATPQGKEYFATTRQDFVQTMLIGSSADAFRRSDFVSFALHQNGPGFKLEMKLPAARDGLPPELEMHVPPQGQPGTLPLLEPEGVTASMSLYLDLAKLWTERKKLINDEIRVQIEDFDKQVSKVLPGTTFANLLLQSGPHHRLCAIHTGEVLYKTKTGQPTPIPAWVISMRDPQLGQSLEGILRTAGLLAGGVVGGMTLKEETIQDTKCAVYTFNEKPSKPVDDPDGIRYNFKPTFGIVKDSFVIAGSPGAMAKLIPELNKTPKPSHPAAWRAKLYAQGTADFVLAHPEPLITESVLNRGIGLAEAKTEVTQLLTWARTLGFGEITIEHGPKAYTFSATLSGGISK